MSTSSQHFGPFLERNSRCAEKPTSCNQTPTALRPCIPPIVSHFVCADFERRQEHVRAVLKSAQLWLRRLLFTERLLIGRSLELWRKMKTTVRARSSIDTQASPFLCGIVRQYESLPYWSPWLRIGDERHLPIMVSFYTQLLRYIYLTFGVLRKEKYASTENKIKQKLEALQPFVKNRPQF